MRPVHRMADAPFSFAAPRVLLVLPAAPAAWPAQSELVIYKEGTDLYHRPGCPVISTDATGVVAMTRAQAEARGYKAAPRLRSRQKKPERRPRRAARPQPPVTVYLNDGKYYHRKDCPKLDGREAVKSESLEKAGKSHWPCPDCRPPVRKKSAEPAVPGTESPWPLSASSSSDCPPSGKTTFYQQRFAATHVHVSKDLWPKSADKAVAPGARAAAPRSPPAGPSSSTTPIRRSPIARAVIAAARELGARVDRLLLRGDHEGGDRPESRPRRQGARPERRHLHDGEADGRRRAG